MFSIKIDNNIIKEVTEIDINLLSPMKKLLLIKEILKANLKYKDDSVIISSIISV